MNNEQFWIMDIYPKSRNRIWQFILDLLTQNSLLFIVTIFIDKFSHSVDKILWRFRRFDGDFAFCRLFTFCLSWFGRTVFFIAFPQWNVVRHFWRFFKTTVKFKWRYKLTKHYETAFPHFVLKYTATQMNNKKNFFLNWNFFFNFSHWKWMCLFDEKNKPFKAVSQPAMHLQAKFHLTSYLPHFALKLNQCWL